jgi:anti-sigma factor RsiW
MDCNKFEESGLLYLSGELSESEARGYEAHIAGCAECRGETELYRKESKELYTADILGDAPRREVSDEIIRVCSNPKKAASAAALTPLLFFKKYAPVSVFLMLVMVAVGGYLKYHSMAAGELRAKLTNDAPAAEQVAEGAEHSGTAAAEEGALALTTDSAAAAGDSNAAFSKTRGSLDVEGVVTVKGQVEK